MLNLIQYLAWRWKHVPIARCSFVGSKPYATLTIALPPHILITTSGSSSVVEHLLPKQRVASSILVSRSKLKSN